MSLHDDSRPRGRALAGPLIVAALVGYFGYHIVQGERGVSAWLQLGPQVEEAADALAFSRAEEQRLIHRVGLLRPTSLDLDMLDERARTVLNLAHPDERVEFFPTSAGTY